MKFQTDISFDMLLTKLTNELKSKLNKGASKEEGKQNILDCKEKRRHEISDF